MKTKFTKEYILSHKGCYDTEEVEEIKCINNKTITLKQLFRDLPIKDFSWFLLKKCDLTIKQKQFFSLHCAEQVVNVYNKKYPEDSRISECVKYTRLYLNGECDLDTLLINKDAATAAAYAAYAADATAAAYAAAAAAAAAYAADAADTAATDAAAYAADAAAAAYRESIWKFVESIK